MADIVTISRRSYDCIDPSTFPPCWKTELKSKLRISEEETQSDPICARQHILPTEVSCTVLDKAEVMQVGSQICYVVQGAQASIARRSSCWHDRVGGLWRRTCSSWRHSGCWNPALWERHEVSPFLGVGIQGVDKLKEHQLRTSSPMLFMWGLSEAAWHCLTLQAFTHPQIPFLLRKGATETQRRSLAKVHSQKLLPYPTTQHQLDMAQRCTISRCHRSVDQALFLVIGKHCEF